MNSTSVPVAQISCSHDLINVGFDHWYELVIRFNWMAVILVIVIVCVSTFLLKMVLKRLTGKTVRIDGISIGIGDCKCTLKCGNEVQEIAYRLWVELTTRKIAIPIEEDDVIVEVYDSWYSAFYAIRELLKTVPGECLKDSAELITITSRVLNEGLRPHLTKWQAKYRVWYEQEKAKEGNIPPQEIQKNYPEYAALIADLKKTNEHMVNFAKKMEEIAFGDIGARPRE